MSLYNRLFENDEEYRDLEKKFQQKDLSPLDKHKFYRASLVGGKLKPTNQPPHHLKDINSTREVALSREPKLADLTRNHINGKNKTRAILNKAYNDNTIKGERAKNLASRHYDRTAELIDREHLNKDTRHGSGDEDSKQYVTGLLNKVLQNRQYRRDQGKKLKLGQKLGFDKLPENLISFSNLTENDEEIRKLERAHQAEPTQNNWNRLHLAKERAGLGKQHIKTADFDEPLSDENAPKALQNYEKLQKLSTVLDKNKDKTHKVLKAITHSDPLKIQRQQNLNNRFSRRFLTVRNRLNLVGSNIRQVGPEGLERRRNDIKQDLERTADLKRQGKVIKDQLKSK